MPLNTYTKICEFFRKPYIITIDQRHVDFANSQTWCRTRFNADSLIFEHDLQRNNYGHKPFHKGHDIIFGNDILLDFKEIFSRWHNIKTHRSYKWLVDCTTDGLVTHYAPYQVINRDRNKDKRENRYYQVGDVLEIQVMEIAEARSYLKRKQKSNWKDYAYYIIPEKNGLHFGENVV